MIDEEKNSFAISSRSNHKMSGLISKKNETGQNTRTHKDKSESNLY